LVFATFSFSTRNSMQADHRPLDFLWEGGIEFLCERPVDAR